MIEDDLRMPISVTKRAASPTRFSRYRTSDGRDHFQYCSVAVNSLNYQDAGGNGTDPVVVRDDTELAMTHAYQIRSAKEMPPLAGSVTIPWLTSYYEIGDLVTTVAGRDISLQTNVGVSTGETQTYAYIVDREWSMAGERQSTVLQLSDKRAMPQPYRG